MSLAETNLDRGAFHFSVPYIWWMWIPWVLGLLLGIAGLVLGLAEPIVMMLGFIGFLTVAFCSPGSLEADLNNVRKTAISPEELAAKAEKSGYEVTSWWLGQSTLVPTNDANDWILPAPGPAAWNNEKPFDADEGGEPLAEHPHKVGTPRPAMLSGFGIWASLAAFCLVVGMYGVMTSENSDAVETEGDPAIMLYAALVVMLILSLVGFFKNRMNKQMLDTPTSLIRSAAVGHPELVGQVRPYGQGSMAVQVGHAPHRTVDRIVAFRWTHEVYRCRTVSDGDGGTKEECDWDTVEEHSDDIQFILHDGTGGMLCDAGTFKRKDWGQFIQRWESRHDDSIGRELFGQIATGLLGGGRIRKHRWTIWGLRLGDPVYCLGNTVSKTEEEKNAQQVDSTQGHQLLRISGEDAPGIRSEIRRGTELSNIGRMRSGIELVALPITTLVGLVALLILA